MQLNNKLMKGKKTNKQTNKEEWIQNHHKTVPRVLPDNPRKRVSPKRLFVLPVLALVGLLQFLHQRQHATHSAPLLAGTGLLFNFIR